MSEKPGLTWRSKYFKSDLLREWVRHNVTKMSVQAAPAKIVTRIPFKQCAFLGPNLNHLGSRSKHLRLLISAEIQPSYLRQFPEGSERTPYLQN